MDEARLVLEYLQALVWPAVAVLLALLFRREVRGVLARLRKVDLPGGVSAEIADAADEAQRLSKELPPPKPPVERASQPSVPLSLANQRMLELGLSPSPSGLDLGYYREIARGDPNLALAGLRMEMEAMLRNVAKGFGVVLGGAPSVMEMTRRLYGASALTGEQRDLIVLVADVCNRAVHGVPVTPDLATQVLDSAEVLRDYYLSWLSWGFPPGTHTAA
jgi:hypothetical protein